MAIIYFTYLFDDDAFRKAVMPIVPQVEAGDYGQLQQLARQTMESKPDLWRVLDNLFLGPPFAEEGEQPTPRRLLTMVLAQFLQPVAEFNISNTWQFLQVALPVIGWGQEEIELLFSGKPLCELLVPGRHNLKEYEEHPQNLPWCTGYVGWLDKESVINLKRRLGQSKEAFLVFTRQPQKAQTEFDVLRDYPNLSIENLSGKLEKFWEKLVEILTLATESQKSLAVAVVW